jgi:hypothetical protein
MAGPGKRPSIILKRWKEREKQGHLQTFSLQNPSMYLLNNPSYYYSKPKPCHRYNKKYIDISNSYQMNKKPIFPSSKFIPLFG